MDTQQHPLLPHRKNRQIKDRWSRISKYLEYLDSSGQKWYSPDMEGFKASLMADDQLALATVAVYISSVKQAYRDLLEAHSLEQLLRNEVSLNVLEETYMQAAKAIEHAIERDTAKIDYERPEDIRHPSFDQVITLIDQISLTSAMDLRDLLVVSLTLFTGMSEYDLPGDEHEAHFTAQDLRRAYAHRLFYIEDDFDSVGKNLGYNTRNTIRNYIGLPNEESHADVDRRGEGSVLIQKVDEFMNGKN